MIVDVNTELRKLRPAEIYTLGLILNPSDNWKKLMASVSKDGSDGVPKFPGEYISIVEQAARQERKLPAVIFLEEWGTMGRKRPSVGLLLNLLMKTELFRAADYLAQDVLKIEAPQRPASGPAASIDVESIAELLRGQNLEESVSNNSNFCLRTTSEIPLSQINYPTSIFDSQTSTIDNNLAVDENDVCVFEMQYAESKSNQVLDDAGVSKNPQSSIDIEKKMENLKNPVSTQSSNDAKITDLMKFSANGSSEEFNRTGSDGGYSLSDLIKFYSEKEHSNDDLQDAIFPDLNILCPTAWTKGDHDPSIDDEARRNRDPDRTKLETKELEVSKNREMSSTELPACLGNFAAAEEFPADVGKHLGANASYFNRELMSAELPLCINDRTGFNSSETNFNEGRTVDSKEDSLEGNSAISEQSLDSETSVSGEVSFDNGSMKKGVPETELPRFVVEAGMRRGNEGDCEVSVERNGGKNTMNSRELPVTVLEFHKR